MNPSSKMAQESLSLGRINTTLCVTHVTGASPPPLPHELRGTQQLRWMLRHWGHPIPLQIPRAPQACPCQTHSQTETLGWDRHTQFQTGQPLPSLQGQDVAVEIEYFSSFIKIKAFLLYDNGGHTSLYIVRCTLERTTPRVNPDISPRLWVVMWGQGAYGNFRQLPFHFAMNLKLL